MTDHTSLVEKLLRNARFYRNEAVSLEEVPDRRDNRKLGADEARTISDLLGDAAAAILKKDGGDA